MFKHKDPLFSTYEKYKASFDMTLYPFSLKHDAITPLPENKSTTVATSLVFSLITFFMLSSIKLLPPINLTYQTPFDTKLVTKTS